MSDENAHNENSSGYEKKDTSIRAIVVTTFVAIVLIVIVIVVLWDYFIATREAIVYEQTLAPVSVQLEELQRHEDSILNSYEFVDSTRGVYRIPIDRAMELMAEGGSGTHHR